MAFVRRDPVKTITPAAATTTTLSPLALSPLKRVDDQTGGYYLHNYWWILLFLVLGLVIPAAGLSIALFMNAHKPDQHLLTEDLTILETCLDNTTKAFDDTRDKIVENTASGLTLTSATPNGFSINFDTTVADQYRVDYTFSASSTDASTVTIECSSGATTHSTVAHTFEGTSQETVSFTYTATNVPSTDLQATLAITIPGGITLDDASVSIVATPTIIL